MLAGIALGGLALLGLTVFFGVRLLENAAGDATGVDAVIRQDAKRIAVREAEAIREQREADAKAAIQREAERKKLRDALSLNVCGGDDAVADELLTALEQVQEETLEAFNSGTLTADVRGFMEQGLLKRMAASATLRKWFGARSPQEFVRAIYGGLGRQQSGDQGAAPGFLGGYVSMGTGFHVSQDGWIVTNAHVVKGARQVDVHTSTGETQRVAVVKTDTSADLALLKAPAGSKVWLPLSRGEAPLGSAVFTIGFPRPTLQGVEPKFTDGTLSSLKGLRDDARHYQISVPVQPGNSGGALVHLQNGWAVGVVCAGFEAGAAQNVNYAIKSSVVHSFIRSTPEARSVLEMPDPEKITDPGALIEKVKSATVLILVPAEN